MKAIMINRFNKAKKFTKDLITREDGATMLEYALMAVLIALAVVGIVYLLGNTMSSKFGKVNDTLGKH